jgi:STE24 endopeptidase
MTSQNWLIILLILIAINYIFSTLLEYINDRNWKDKIPKSLKDFYEKDKYLKAKEYKKINGKLSFISSTISFLITISLLVLGIYGKVSDYFMINYQNIFVQSSLFFLSFYLLNQIVSIPFQYYSTFSIEAKFGFNKTTLKTFVLDKLKGMFLALIIGGILLYVALLLYSKINNGFWIYLWLGLSIFTLFIQMFYTTLIVPLFNKLTPLEDGSLKNKIENYSKKIGYSLSNIFVIDGSKRSTKANAFFSGIGPKKTIALFDTLLEKHTEEELVAVLAHEVGHYKKNHIFQGLVLTIIQIGLMTYLLELCLNNSELINSFNWSIYEYFKQKK